MRPSRDQPVYVTFFQNRLPDGAQPFRMSWEDEEASFPWDEIEWVVDDWIYKEHIHRADDYIVKVFLWDQGIQGVMECERLGVLSNFGRDEDGTNWLEF